MNNRPKCQMFISIYRVFFHPSTAILNQILVKCKRLFGNFDPSIHFLVSSMRLMFSEGQDGCIPVPAWPVRALKMK